MNRKKFLLSSSFFLLSVNFLRSETLIYPSYSCLDIVNNDKTNVDLLLKKAAKLRKKILSKKNNQGMISRRSFFSSSGYNSSNVYTIYDQILDKDSSEIRAYNGKRKFMIQEKEDVVEILKMYIKGVEENADNALFRDRIAKECFRILTGNIKEIKRLPAPYNKREYLLESIEKNLLLAKKMIKKTFNTIFS